jgi:hypothetical protein
MLEVIPPADWRPWLGGMSAINFVGLLVYRVTRDRFRNAAPRDSREATLWKVRTEGFRKYLVFAVLLGVALQLAVYASFGGVAGYIDAVEQQRQTFLGCSYIAMVTESVPILALMFYVFHVWLKKKVPSWLTLFLVLGAFGAIKLLFGGLDGLRTNMVFAMFWAVGMVHFCIRPVPKKFILGGIVGLVAFMYLYGFYKSAGLNGLQTALRCSAARVDMEQEIGRPIQSTLLADLGRSDVQAFILYRQMQRDSDCRYGFGRTYVAAMLSLIPGPLWRDRPPTVVKEGTEILYGRGSYRHRPVGSASGEEKWIGKSSRVYGLGGEAMLNFGPPGVPLAFAVMGVAVGCVSRWLKTWHPRDARRLLVPFLVLVCLETVINDSTVVITALHQFFLFPLLVVAVASERRRRAVKSSTSPCPATTSPAIPGRMPAGGHA